MTIDELRCALRGVAAYRHIVDAPLMGLTLELLDRLASGDGTGAVERYARLFYELRQADCSGLGMWLHDQLRYQESPYARLVERGGEDPALEEAARRDVETFTLLSELDCDAVLREIGTQAPREFSRVLANLPGGAEDAPLPFRGLRRFIRPTGRAFSPATTPFYGRMGLCGRWSSPTAPVPAR